MSRLISKQQVLVIDFCQAGNPFYVIRRCTSRTEPFHSRFLASLISQSPDLLASTLKECNWNPVSPEKYQCAEEYDFNRSGNQIDVLIGWPNLVKPEHLLGIEVKTSDHSTSSGQLQKYWDLMEDQFGSTPDRHLLYLVPYTEDCVKAVCSESKFIPHAVVEYKSFTNEEPEGSERCTIMGWKRMCELEMNAIDSFEQDLAVTLKQQVEYLRDRVCSDDEIRRKSQNRGLDEFFKPGSDITNKLKRFIAEKQIPHKGNDKKLTFSLDDPKFYKDLIEALKLLICNIVKDEGSKPEDRSKAVRESFLNQSSKLFYEKLFDIVSKSHHLYLEGRSNLGLRSTHPNHKSSGVSICTLYPNKVEIVLLR